ncbi:Gfo/Idh/MocA family protein [Actinoplanes sp. TFC3]|uniref:Gfo/Idh/MocA family oxidoreductase n=1 Tax=Actinoplanes sp. TFC3 TaxID=1710355 RepID=UPI00082C2388|nr:Gfo/Idh/MocA family oxidoreductase [Actinoplanes sp. TFC3]
MTTSNPRIRLAVVGSGIIGRHQAKAALAQGDFEVAAFIDDTLGQATEAADAVETAGHPRPVAARTIAEALAATAIDLFTICTPSGLHVDLAEEALATGKHVVIEKPLDTTMPRARRIAQAAAEARRNGAMVSVISQHRVDPASVLVTKTAHDGGFGRVTSGVCSVAWYRSQGYYDSGAWRGTWALDGGGAVSNQGVHTVDLLVWALGRPVEITATTALLGHERIEVEDVAVATVRFESGALGVIHCTTAAYPGLSARYAVYGTHGSAVIEDDRLAYFHAAPPSSTLASASTTGNSPAAEGAGDQKAGLVPPEHSTDGPAEKDHFLAGHIRQYADLSGAIRDQREPAVTVEAALLTLATVRGLYLSATLGRPIRIDDVLAGEYDGEPEHNSDPIEGVAR